MKLKSALFLWALMFVVESPVLAAEAGRVVVTIKPLHSLVAGVMGETGTPDVLVTGAISPHEFQLKPSQVQAFQSPTILFYIDERFETFLRGIFKTLPSHVHKAGVVHGAELALLPRRQGGIWEEHTHGVHKSSSEHMHEHDDMHVWLDPDNAKKIVTFIAKELSTVYPKNKEIYQANAHTLIDRLQTLDVKLKHELSGLKHKKFIVFHDAYHYFENHYGLDGVGSITFEPGEAAFPNRIRALRKTIRDAKVTCVFREPYVGNRLVSTIIEGSSAKVGTLDPEGTALAPGHDFYFTLMEDLAKNFQQCFAH